MDNLPNWPGASAIYFKIGAAARELGRRQYAAWLVSRDKRKGVPFRVDEDLEDIMREMGEGDEETLKGRALALAPVLRTIDM
jgi:hypothetical protein